MIFAEKSKSRSPVLETYSLYIVIAWTIIVGGFLLFGIFQIQHVQQKMVKNEARANFNKDQAFRLWATTHGGVYVPITEKTPQNPYLSHVKDRDIKTPDGKALTLMNPAYMLRQTMEEYESLYGIRGHLTSLKYFRPETAPDEWEKSTLQKFEIGAKDIFEVTEKDGKPYFRYMSPMIVEKGCLKCHGHQGYQVGGVRGGVSVSVPMAPYLANQYRQTITYAFSLGILWLLGLSGFIWANRGLKNRARERDIAEAELREREARYGQLFNSGNDAVFVHGLVKGETGKFTEINDVACIRLGYRREELLRMSPSDIDAEGMEVERRRALEMMAKTGQCVFEMVHVAKSGDRIPMEISSSVIEIGGDRHVLSIARDITERIQAEETVRENKEILQKIFDGILDPLIMLNANLEVRLLNKAASEYYFVDQESVLGKPCYQAFKARSEPCIGCDVPVAISAAQSTAFERKGLSGPYGFEKISIYLLNERNGEPKEFIMRIHDITERKLIERQIIQSEKMASLGVLMSSVAHEINNPNNFISFNIPILKDYINEMIPFIDEYAVGRPEFMLCNQTYPEFRQDIFNLLVNIENGSVRISSFVSNLREYSQYRGKKPRIRVELKDIIEKVLSICHSKIRNSVKSFVKNVPEHLPAIYTEPYTIDQILINFLVNASQAADKENSWIKLNIIVNDVGQQHISIEVSDNGCGMDEETQLKIFDPFFTTKSPVDGTGLGLYVCHTLAERLKGRIEIESEPGEGSMFRLILPLKDQN